MKPTLPAARLAAVILALGAAGCVTPVELAQRGRLVEAYQATGEHPEARAAVASTIVRAEAPVLTVEAVEGDALVELVGETFSHEMEPGWVLLRGTVRTRPGAFAYARFRIAIGREGAEVASYDLSREHVALVTGEKVPRATWWSGSSSGSSGVSSGNSCGGNAVCEIGRAIFGGGSHGGGASPGFLKPSEQDILREAPRAVRVVERLRDRCHDAGSCVRYFLVRRPKRADEPLLVRARVELAREWIIPHFPDGPPPSYASPPASYGEEYEAWKLRMSKLPPLAEPDEVFSPSFLGVRVTVPLPPAARFAARFPVVVDPARASLVEDGADESHLDHFCSWAPADVAEGSGRCLVPLVPLGASQPPAPTPPLPIPSSREIAPSG